MMMRMWLGMIGALSGTIATAQDTGPLSAIDWLSQSVEPPAIVVTLPSPIDEPPTSNGASSPNVTVTSLDAPSPDPIGLLPVSVTGLPRDLWASSNSDTLSTLILEADASILPATQALLMTLLLAEADPPLGAGPDGQLFLARVDKLLDIGALEPALAMLEQVNPENPELFRRWFDVSLLIGAEDDACQVMRDTPNVAPTLPARIFCLARGGDWPAAALTLNTHRVLGDVTPQEEALLSRFLDPDLYEDEPPLPVPDRISPLVFRMHEAIGEALPTRALPNAFAHSDLRDTTGWKAQLEAAERLARVGAINENVLLDIYTAKKPAASGGVWDRAGAVQRLEAALADGDSAKISQRLNQAWAAMETARLEVPFAKMFEQSLAGIANDTPELALQIGLLTASYETAAQNTQPQSFLTSLAQGAPINTTGPQQTAIHAAFTGADPSPELEAMARNGNLGEALLQSLSDFQDGVAGDAMALTDTIAFWRFVGLEGVARQAALQLLMLERRI